MQAVHHEHLLQASIEDVYLHLPASEIRAELDSVETTIVFLEIESFTELTQPKATSSRSRFSAGSRAP
jgi:hypothetical protein